MSGVELAVSLRTSGFRCALCYREAVHVLHHFGAGVAEAVHRDGAVGSCDNGYRCFGMGILDGAS